MQVIASLAYRKKYRANIQLFSFAVQHKALFAV